MSSTNRGTNMNTIDNGNDPPEQYEFRNAHYFARFQDYANNGMKALDCIVPFGNYKPLDRRDIIYGINASRRRSGPDNPDPRVNKTIHALRGMQEREIINWTVKNAGEPKPPIRYCCYISRCAYSANNRRELIRHFSQSSPQIHPGITYEGSLVFGVPHDDWMRDEDLVCTLAGTTTSSWYREFKRREFGLNRLEDPIQEQQEEGSEDDDEDQDEAMATVDEIYRQNAVTMEDSSDDEPSESSEEE